MQFGGRDRRRSPSKHGTGGYYQFTFEEDLSGSEDGGLNLSPREFVEQALRDTELDTTPATYSDTAPLPEPDFSIHELLEELEDYRPDPSVHLSGHSSADNSPSSTPDERPGTPESLHSPLDHPDSGYIEFVHPRSPSSLASSGGGTRSPSEGFDDDFHVPTSHGNLSQDGDLGVKQQTLPAPAGSKASKQSLTLPQVVFRRCKADFNKLEEDSFIDDDLLRSGLPSGAGGAREVELRDLGGQGGDLGEPRSDLRHSSDGQYLPMSGDMTMEHEQDTMLDPERGATDDVSPIIFMEQTSLSERQKARRRKITIIVAVLAGVFGLIALAAISYLLVRFLGT